MLWNKLCSGYGVLVLCVGREVGEGRHKKNDDSANFIVRAEKAVLIKLLPVSLLASQAAI
jgi:hypothetical protein